jgi:RNA polymerase sigma factor (sigma-70 family)
MTPTGVQAGTVVQAGGGRSHAVLSIEDQFTTTLAAARANAGWAFEWLFHTFAPRVHGYLRSHGVTEPDEVTNDVFLAVFRSLDRFAGDEQAFRAWTFTIARNRLVDEYRRRARRIRTIPGDDAAGLAERAGGDVEAEALTNIGSEWAVDLIRRLAPDQRDVLLLRIVADLTIDQIAEVVGKRPGAVKALQRRGLAAARRILEQGVPHERTIDV